MSQGMVSCSGCKAEYDASGYDPGDRFECPECKTIVTVGGAAPAAAPRASRPATRGNTGRTTRGNTGRSSRPPMTAKMRVVNEAVGMGALDPGVDPRAIRRASQAPPPVTDNSSDKMMYIIGGCVAAIACIGAIIYIAKQPSAEEKKHALMEKKAAAAAKEEEKTKTAGSASANPDKPKVHVDNGWDVDAAIDAEVQKTLAALKSHPLDAEYAATAAKLLKYGRSVIPALVESWPKVDPESADVSRRIVDAATGRGLPEELFVDKLKRLDMAMTFRQWWLTDAGQAAQLKSEEEFTRRLTGGAVAVAPNPGNPEKPVGTPPTQNPGGVNEIKKPAGGVSASAMRRDLPQHLSNIARGTFEQREEAKAEVRKYGKQVIPVLIEALKEEDTAMCRVANDLLKEFTKQDFGVPPGEPGDRPPFIQKWNDWWKGAEASFSM
ncbi:MAG: hypothetical protein K8T20_19355 [Planctomycetes bacterium]|nr:hypothetical protein [Planctomycetota bacterium]